MNAVRSTIKKEKKKGFLNWLLFLIFPLIGKTKIPLTTKERTKESRREDKDLEKKRKHKTRRIEPIKIHSCISKSWISLRCLSNFWITYYWLIGRSNKAFESISRLYSFLWVLLYRLLPFFSLYLIQSIVYSRLPPVSFDFPSQRILLSERKILVYQIA